MYIKRLYLENIRCFKELEINFDYPGSSILIVGDNGEGKSTLLRSLAMGLCDESSASALFRELSGEFVRRKFDQKSVEKGAFGQIEIDLISDEDEGHSQKIVTKITSLETFERVSQYEKAYRVGGPDPTHLNQDFFPWDKIFVTGYGAGSRTQGTADVQHYLAVDAVYPLFRYDVPLQNPELVMRRLIEAARKSRRSEKEQNKREAKMLDTIKKMLSPLLNLEDSDKLHLTPTGIEIEGRWGRSELGELGDGYKATVIWVLDFISWWFLRVNARGGWKIDNIKGVVLIDEIEQHLHPRWQRQILSMLKKTFPKVQFIATTHSPLCAAGAADLGEKNCKIIRLKQTNGSVTKSILPLPYGFRADQILTSDIFELSDTRNPEVGEKIIRYRELCTKKVLSNDEKNEYARLRRFIFLNVPDVGQFEEERRLRDELRGLVGQLGLITKNKTKK